MKCQFCMEKATVYFSKVIDDKEAKVGLCESCAKEKGIGDPAKMLAYSASLLEDGPSPFGVTEAPSEGQLAGALPIDPENEENVCPSCGFSLADFLKVGRLGCSTCYCSFDEEIRSRLGKLHLDVTHRGHVPNNLESDLAQNRQLLEFQKKLDQAIMAEDYELASQLKKSIEELKEKLTAASA